MPKEKDILKLIPKIYRRNAEDLGLFFWVKAQQDIVPTLKIEQAIMSYFRYISITVDEWDIDCAKSTYTRMQNEFFKDETAKKT